ncbi:MbeD family mobilization/exclusion protein [Salmonella enterica]|nr:MbeD family mobilization/exclusion protein [Salmonella enterica subsp. enterica serovar Newport]ELD7046043.1 MbeD family mobilization/exclusion protein [Salmonella enterica]
MTELETQLLSAFEQLQQDYAQQLNAWEAASSELQKMFGITQRENARLSEQVSALSQQVQSLSVQLRRLTTQ